MKSWVYIAFGTIIAAINIIMTSMTLIKVIKQGEYKVVIKIITILILSNIMLMIYFGSALTNNLIVLCAAWGLGFVCFNIAHWMFVYEYYNVIRIMSYIEEDKPVPEHVTRCNQV